EIDLAGLIVEGPVGEPRANRQRLRRAALTTRLQHLALADRKQDAHEIRLDYGRQNAGFGTNQVARRDYGAPDRARNRGFDISIGQLDLGVAQRRLGLEQGSAGARLIGGSLVERRLRDRIVTNEKLRP